MNKFSIANLKITAITESAEQICYILYPLDTPGIWVEKAAHKLGVSIVVITGMDWGNDMTPWPAKGQPPGCPDFKGDAPKFLNLLTGTLIPEIERRLNIIHSVKRTLAGVSLSGLFTLWQWITDDTFLNIISLSGSFWYDGLIDWIKARPIPQKAGKAYFLLGDLEAKAKVKAFQSVQTNTIDIVRYLGDNGIHDCFELVPGNHYQYPEQRLDRALSWIYGKTPD